jgi:hypothetical protein
MVGFFLEVSLLQRCFIVFRCTTSSKKKALSRYFFNRPGRRNAWGVMSEPTIPDVELIDNTSQRLPCILLLDASRSIADSLRDRMNADSFI